MKHNVVQVFFRFALGTVCIAGVSTASVLASEPPAASPEQAVAADSEAAAYLEFYSQIDGKCHILSAGGKLTLMKNNHDTKAIRYRLTRIFAGIPQPSLAVGIIEPGAEGKPLGCTLVDGHEQTWRVEKAVFLE